MDQVAPPSLSSSKTMVPLNMLRRTRKIDNMRLATAGPPPPTIAPPVPAGAVTAVPQTRRINTMDRLAPSGPPPPMMAPPVPAGAVAAGAVPSTTLPHMRAINTMNRLAAPSPLSLPPMLPPASAEAVPAIARSRTINTMDNLAPPGPPPPMMAPPAPAGAVPASPRSRTTHSIKDPPTAQPPIMRPTGISLPEIYGMHQVWERPEPQRKVMMGRQEERSGPRIWTPGQVFELAPPEHYDAIDRMKALDLVEERFVLVAEMEEEDLDKMLLHLCLCFPEYVSEMRIAFNHEKFFDPEEEDNFFCSLVVPGGETVSTLLVGKKEKGHIKAAKSFKRAVEWETEKHWGEVLDDDEMTDEALMMGGLNPEPETMGGYQQWRADAVAAGRNVDEEEDEADEIEEDKEWGDEAPEYEISREEGPEDEDPEDEDEEEEYSGEEYSGEDRGHEVSGDENDEEGVLK